MGVNFFPGHVMGWIETEGPSSWDPAGTASKIASRLDTYPLHVGVAVGGHPVHFLLSETTSDFSALPQWITACEARGKKFWFHCMDRVFNGTRTGQIPAFIRNDYAYLGGEFGGVSREVQNGVAKTLTLKTWEADIMDIWIAHLKRLLDYQVNGIPIKAHPVMGGITFEESATDQGENNASENFSYGALVTQWARMISEIDAHGHDIPIYIGNNSFGGGGLNEPLGINNNELTIYNAVNIARAWGYTQPDTFTCTTPIASCPNHEDRQDYRMRRAHGPIGLYHAGGVSPDKAKIPVYQKLNRMDETGDPSKGHGGGEVADYKATCVDYLGASNIETLYEQMTGSEFAARYAEWSALGMPVDTTEPLNFGGVAPPPDPDPDPNPQTGAFLQEITSGDNLIVIEAENFHRSGPDSGSTHSWQVDARSVTGTPSGTIMAALRTSDQADTSDQWSTFTDAIVNAPYIEFDIEVLVPGFHDLWLRHAAPGGGSNSFHVALDGAVWEDNFGVANTGGALAWSLGNSIEFPQSGPYTVRVMPRDQGTPLDRVVITTNTNYDPNSVNGGVGPAESAQTPIAADYGSGGGATADEFTGTAGDAIELRVPTLSNGAKWHAESALQIAPSGTGAYSAGSAAFKSAWYESGLLAQDIDGTIKPGGSQTKFRLRGRTDVDNNFGYSLDFDIDDPTEKVQLWVDLPAGGFEKLAFDNSVSGTNSDTFKPRMTITSDALPTITVYDDTTELFSYTETDSAKVPTGTYYGWGVRSPVGPAHEFDRIGCKSFDMPTINPITDKSVAEGSNLTVAVAAFAANGGIPVITATGTPLSQGAIFTDNLDGTGQINWNPSNSDIPGSPYNVTIRATDPVDPTRYTELTFQIAVFSTGTAMFDVQEDAGTLTVTVYAPDPIKGGSVNYEAKVSPGDSAVDGIDFDVGSGTLVFAPGDVTQTFDVDVHDVPGPDGDKFFTLLLINAEGPSAGTTARARVKILDLG